MRNTWTPIDIEENTEGNYTLHANGKVSRDIDLYLTPEQLTKLKQGYMCIRCFGLTDSAFPETCGTPGCDGYPKGFPMRARQREVMESEMHDETRKEPSPRTDIWLPGGMN